MKKCIVLIVSFVAMATYAQAPDTLWTKTYGGAEDDVGSSIQQTSDGGYIIAGYTESFGAGESDVWILRLDSLGDTLWTKTYGTAGRDYAVSIQQTTDGGYIIAGVRDYTDIWLLKTNEYGDTLWTSLFRPYNPWVSDVIQTSDGGYLIAGGGGGHTFYYGFLIKTNSLGDSLWIGGYGESCSAVQETPDSNYVITGLIGHGASGSCPAFYLTKVDRQGTILWDKVYWDTLAYSSIGNDVFVTSDGCLTACGGWGEEWWVFDICLIHTDANGDTLWTKRFCDGSAISLDMTFDGGYIVVGNTSGDVVFIRTDSSGETLWTAIYGGPEGDGTSAVLQTSDGGYIMVGTTSSFGAGNADVWIIKLDSDVGVEENKNIVFENENRTTTIFRGPLRLPEGKKCKVFDITGRVMEPATIAPGIYFLEIDHKIVQKVIKIR